MAQHCDVTVLTRSKRKPAIDAYLAAHKIDTLHFKYLDLPALLRRMLGVQLYYYMWQCAAVIKCRLLHRKHSFDVVHHVTLGRYWTWSACAFSGAKFLWGPVGGGESAPPQFEPGFGISGMLTERFRRAARWLGEHDPFFRIALARSACAIAVTRETATRLRAHNASRIELISHVALNRKEISDLAACSTPPSGITRFVSIGRLLCWKGFHLALEAYARARIANSEYWIIGDGPDMTRLKAIALQLNLKKSAIFKGQIPRTEVLAALSQCHVLLHPSLHESGGWVCAEAMAAARPVICLNLGGPAEIVPDSAGIKIDANSPAKAIADMAEAMNALAADSNMLARMSADAQKHAAQNLCWEEKAVRIKALYQHISEAE